MGTESMLNDIIANSTPEQSTKENSTPEQSTPETEQPQVNQDDDKFASRFAALSKKEKAILERERQLKAEMEEIKAFKKRREEAKGNPLEYLKAEGLELEDILHSALGSKVEPTVEDKIKQLQDKIEQKEKEEKERLEQEKHKGIEKAIAELKADIKKTIDGDKENYELLSYEDSSTETVVELMEAWLAKTGELLPISDACKKIEAHMEAELDKLLQTKKIANKLATFKESKPSETSLGATLSNKQASESAASRFLTDEESKKEAAKLLKWT